MSLKSKFISVITVGASVVVFAAAGFAQDDKTTTATTTAPDKVERQGKGEGREFGKHEHGDRKFGREGFEGRHGRMGGERMMFRDLNLTDAQKAQIKAIRESNKPDAATIAEMKAIHESRKAGTALTAEQQDRMKAFREQGRIKMQSAHEQIMGILTAEQKAQIETRKTEMKQRFEERKLKFEERRKERQSKPATIEKPKVN